MMRGAGEARRARRAVAPRTVRVSHRSDAETSVDAHHAGRQRSHERCIAQPLRSADGVGQPFRLDPDCIRLNSRPSPASRVLAGRRSSPLPSLRSWLAYSRSGRFICEWC